MTSHLAQTLLFLLAGGLFGFAQSAPHPAEVFPAASLAQRTQQLIEQARHERSASATLGQYGNHELMLAVREEDGSAELHAHFNDVMLVQRGDATLVTGGAVIAPQTTAPGEIRGSGIRGGTRQAVHPGDVIHIPPNTPHQFLVVKGTEFAYFVVKVREP